VAKSVVGPWARDKLDRLGKYLTAYTTIMKDQSWCEGYHYIDAFAGPGEHTVRQSDSDKRHAAQQALLDVSSFGAEQKEQQEFLAGSPRVALEIPHPFTHYVFVEHSPDRIAALEKLKAEYGKSRSIIIRQENCTIYLRDRVVSNPKINWKKHRAIVFLDPFGMQVNCRRKWGAARGRLTRRSGTPTIAGGNLDDHSQDSGDVIPAHPTSHRLQRAGRGRHRLCVRTRRAARR
jgi:hypothetical protein